MKYKLTVLVLSFIFLYCESDSYDSHGPSVYCFINFTHKWNESTVNASNFNTIQYTNAFGNQLSIERLRYLISEIKVTKANGEIIVISNYSLVDLQDESSLKIVSNQSLLPGPYNDISFIFGFTNEANNDGAYPDLNSASWNVPPMLGGGYHYMQLDGKYLNGSGVEVGYNYHAIRAAENSGVNPTFVQDTFFEVSLGPTTLSNNGEIRIVMNIAKWFEQPNLWDLNIYNQMLMPNSEAQIMMYENGQNVFYLESVE